MKKEYNGNKINIDNLDKVFFPEAKISKGDLLDYYEKVSEYMLPHVKDRPMMMHRFPDGINGTDFYQKNVPDYFLEWIETEKIKDEDSDDITEMLLCNNLATLIYITEQGSISSHVWLSRVEHLEKPDKIVFDLDPPGESRENFSDVVDAAKSLKIIFEKLEMKPYVMTSGSKGLHVAIPIKPEHKFEEVKDFAGKVADFLAETNPDKFTTEFRKKERKGRVFLDMLRVEYHQTSVAPYSVRAREGAPVASPIEWEEINDELTPQRYDIKNIFEVLMDRGDPWKDLYGNRCSISKAMEEFKVYRKNG